MTCVSVCGTLLLYGFVLLCACLFVYLAMLAQPLIADNSILPELQHFINEQC